MNTSYYTKRIKTKPFHFDDIWMLQSARRIQWNLHENSNLITYTSLLKSLNILEKDSSSSVPKIDCQKRLSIVKPVWSDIFSFFIATSSLFQVPVDLNIPVSTWTLTLEHNCSSTFSKKFLKLQFREGNLLTWSESKSENNGIPE